MKIFRIDDDHYFAAETKADALACAMENWGMEPGDDDAPDECVELDEGSLDEMEYEDDDGTVRSFREQLAKELAEGRETPYPFAMRE